MTPTSMSPARTEETEEQKIEEKFDRRSTLPPAYKTLRRLRFPLPLSATAELRCN